jgi:hypothetical protein
MVPMTCTLSRVLVIAVCIRQVPVMPPAFEPKAAEQRLF